LHDEDHRQFRASTNQMKYQVYTAILILAFTVACGQGEESLMPLNCEAETTLRESMSAGVDSLTSDDEDTLAYQLIPGGFGGVYQKPDNPSTLVVIIKDSSKNEEATAAFEKAHTCQALYPELQYSSIEIQAGNYDTKELANWKTLAEPIAKDGDVSGLAIDVPSNKLSVKVNDEITKERMSEYLLNNGVPEDAFSITKPSS
jgi:hypothetical protein